VAFRAPWRLALQVRASEARGVLESLRLLDFRCFETLSLEVPTDGLLLVGGNAQGKTSLLEAVCLLVRLHSPRSRRMATMVRHGCDGFGVAGQAWDSDRKVRHAGRNSRLLVEGEVRKGPSDYLSDGGLVVWMGNEDIELVRGSGGVRRHFLDFLGSQLLPEYRGSLARYRRALKARNLLLRDRQATGAEIDAYDELLIRHGTKLQAGREEMVRDLSPFVAEAQARIGGDDESVGVEYRPAGGGELAGALAAARDRDRRSGQTSVGPHRDDMLLGLRGMPADDFASEGQQRTLALSLKLAQGKLLEERREKLPVYLLDDIFGELEPARRNALMAHLPERAQRWITTTHLDWLEDANPAGGMRRFEVVKGTVRG